MEPNCSAAELPLVSVMVPTYNQAQWIEETIRSILDQDYPNIEIVIADDDSSDGTKSIVQRLAAEHPEKVTLLLADENLGVTRNCNRALAACRGKYIAITGGDDPYLPQKISAQVRWLEESPSRVVCGHDMWVIDEAGNRVELWSSRMPLGARGGAAEVIRMGIAFPGSSSMFRRSALPRGGFDERIPISSDIKFWIDCLASGGEYGVLPEAYGQYRRRNGSLTWHARNDALGEQRGFEEYLMIIASVEARYPMYTAACRQARGLVFGRRAWRRYRRGEVAEARLYARHALRERARGNWLAWTSLVLSYVPPAQARACRRLASRVYNGSPRARRALAKRLGGW